MFYTDGREYRAIGLTLPGASSAGEYVRLFTNRLHRFRLLEHGEPGIEIAHGLYLRDTRFAATPDVGPGDQLYPELVVRVGKKSKYAYDTYIATMSQKRATISIIAVPLAEMAKEVWEAIDVRSRGTNLEYWRVDLANLLKTTSGIAKVVPVSVSSVIFRVKADIVSATIRLDADGVVRTKSFAHIMNLPSDQGAPVEPTWAKFRLALDGGPKFSMEADDYGNFKFYVGRRGGNLVGMRSLVEALLGTGCLVPVLGSPIRALRADRE